MKLPTSWDLMSKTEQHKLLQDMIAEFLNRGGTIQNVPANENTIKYTIPWHTRKWKGHRDEMS